MESKIKAAGSLSKILAKLKDKGKSIVFTNGCFDILHIGHVEYLKRAKGLGDILVVGLNSDGSVRRIKGMGRPVNNQKDRAKILAALYSVDYITVFNEATPEKLIRRIKPDVLVKGSDWKAGDIVGAKTVKSRGGRVVRVPFVKGYSTTSVIGKLCRGRAFRRK